MKKPSVKEFFVQ